MIMKRIIYILTFALAAFACVEKDDRIEAVEIGAMEENVTLECVEGRYVMDVLANGDYTAVISEGDWLTFDGGEMSYVGESDGQLGVCYQMNRGASRTAKVVLSRRGRKAEVVFTQKGIIDMGLSLEGHNLTAAHSGGLQSVRMQTLMKNDELIYEVVYDGPQGWITDIRKENNTLTFNVLQNASEQSRSAVIKVTCKADEKLYDELHVVQGGTATVYQELTFDDLHALAAEENIVSITDSYLLSGWVINDNSEGNGAEAKNISAELQDTQRASRVIYVQNDDASAGVMVEFKTEQDNTTERFNHITLNLKGMTLVKYPASEKEPLRYELSGAVVSNIMQTEGGSVYDIPVKEKHISDLTDADVYTYVTLTDCEIPVRKGPFVPVDMRYDNVMNKYPMPLRDITGASTYLLSNTSCAWARDGKGMPQGAGKVSGVIVHEKCDNYSWDNMEASMKMASGLELDYVTGVGTISRYQIRPVAKAEIALSNDFGDSFSGMLMEVRYLNRNYDNLIKNTDEAWSIYSTWPSSSYPMNDPTVTGVLRRFRKNSQGKYGQEGFAVFRDWTHLGPVVDGRITNPSGGNGVTDSDGTSAHWSVHSSTNISGLIIDENGSGWYCSKWTDDQYVRAEFNTEGLSENNFPISITFGAINGLGESVGAPRYWQLDWSVDGKTWNKVADYTVPDFPIVYKKRTWQCPGYKMMTFNLPENSALLGKSKVYVRLKASSQQAGTMDSYDAGAVSSGSQSALNYFAVRYNKN